MAGGSTRTSWIEADEIKFLNQISGDHHKLRNWLKLCRKRTWTVAHVREDGRVVYLVDREFDIDHVEQVALDLLAGRVPTQEYSHEALPSIVGPAQTSEVVSTVNINGFEFE